MSLNLHNFSVRDAVLYLVTFIRRNFGRFLCNQSQLIFLGGHLIPRRTWDDLLWLAEVTALSIQIWFDASDEDEV